MHSKIHFRFLEKLHIDARDLAVFLLSLLLAFGIWLVHNLTLRYSAIMNVTVSAVSNIQGRAAESSNTAVISARCRASGFKLLKSRRNEEKTVRVFFKPEEFTSGDNDTYYLSSNVLASYVPDIYGEDVQLESFVTQNAIFRFQEEDYRKVPVLPRIITTFRPQYTSMGGIQFSPDSVMLYGDPNYLESIDRVFTRPLELKNLRNDAHGDIMLDVPPGLRASEQSVSYSIQVTRYVEISSEIHVDVINLPADKYLSVYPSTAKVVFRCVFPLSVDPARNVSLYIDYEEFAQSINGRCVARLTGLPSSVIDYTVEPQIFECMEE